MLARLAREIVTHHSVAATEDNLCRILAWNSELDLYTKPESEEIASDELVKAVLTTLANELKMLHKEGKCHGYIRPENVIIDHEGNIDFMDPESSKQMPRKTGNDKIDFMLAQISQEFCAPEQSE